MQIEMMCEGTMDETGITADDIEAVFLAGGNPQMPCG